jgi:serine/threonine protein kinase
MSSTELGPDLPGLHCLSKLGSGGYADVYLYERDQPKIRVAVKLMKSTGLDDAKRRQFAAEADAMAELAGHPFIVPVLGAGTASDGRPYLVMQYYPSSDLAARVASNPMSVPDALRLGVQLSSAVETAHRANIIHRDIKPSNILLSSYGQPGLSDFGIAGRPNDTSEESALGVSMPWSPPEVLTGASNGSETSDVYSLAATVWTLLVGHAPFHIPGGDNSERATFTRIVHGRPPPTGRGDVATSLDRLLQQALVKDPAHRPQSALELARHFQRIEQELRLARTETVLLDRGGAAVASRTPTAPSHDPGTAPGLDATTVGNRAPAEVDDAATQRRVPRRVERAQTPPPPASSPSRQPASTPSFTASTPREPANTPPNRGNSAQDPAASKPTELRPRTSGRVQDVPIAEPTKRGSKPALLTSGIVVCLLAIGIALALSGGAGKPRSGKTTTSPAITNPAAAVPPTSAAPTDPSIVSGKVIGRSVVFSWPPVTGVTEYSWSAANGPSHTTNASRLRIARPAHGSMCITVHSVAPGYPISPGKHSCVS